MATATLFKSFVDKGRNKLRTGYIDFECDDDYPGAGWPLDIADVNPNVSTVYFSPIVMIGGYIAKWDYENGKVFIYEQTGDAGSLQDLQTADALAGETIRFYYEGQ